MLLYPISIHPDKMEEMVSNTFSARNYGVGNDVGKALGSVEVCPNYFTFDLGFFGILYLLKRELYIP